MPDDHVNGIVLGYRIFYKKANKPIDDFSNLTVNSSVFDVEINSLEFFTTYELRVLAFTMVGDGNISMPVFCMTDEDGKYSFCIQNTFWLCLGTHCMNLLLP